MKALSLLLFTIVTLGDSGEAFPTQTESEKRVVDQGDPFPVLTTQVLAPQATSFQFYTSLNWKADKDASNDQAAQGVLGKMNDIGLFTAVVLYSSKSSVVGASGGGLTTPDEYLKENSVESALITNGAFFIMGNDKDLVSDFKDGQKGTPLPPAQYKGWSVGPTSLTKNAVGVPSVYADLYERYTAEDRTFLYSGPDLKEPVDTTVPPQALANTDAGRLQYFVRDEDGNRIPAPPPENFLRTEFTHVPGGLVTANEPNERNVLVIVDAGVKVVCAYTSSRNVGMTINGMRDLIDAFLQGYLQGKRIEATEMALNLDGGGSVYVAWVNNGQTEVLAAGNLANPTQEPANFKLRRVTTILKHSVPVALQG